MWCPLTDNRFGIMKVFSDSIVNAVQAEPAAIPNLHSARTIFVTSDYSGQHKESKFEAYGFLFISTQNWPDWEMRRQKLRQIYRTDRRRLSFKALGDIHKQRVLPHFLASANAFSGLCACVLIDKA